MDLLSILSADNYHDRFNPNKGSPKHTESFHSLEQLDLENQTRYDHPFPRFVFEAPSNQDRVAERSPEVVARSENKKRDQSIEADQRREPPKKKRRPSKANTEVEGAVTVIPPSQIDIFRGV